MRQGKVKWYNGKKCFGFISPDTANESGNQDDVFVHSSALKDSDIRFLNENDVVEFDDEPGNNGKLSATNLKLIKRDEESAKKFQERRSSYRDRDGGYDRPRRDFGDRPRRDFGDRPHRDRDEGDRKPGWKFWGAK